jgi:hypothetical protein
VGGHPRAPATSVRASSSLPQADNQGSARGLRATGRMTPERMTVKTSTKLFAAAALSLATISGASFAQAASVSAGQTVYGPDGAEVGKIDKVENGTAILNTGTHTLGLTLDKFGKSDKGPTISVNKAQLDELVEKANADAAAKLDAALVAGATVVDNTGTALGTIDSVKGDAIVLKTDKGPVSLTRKYFAMNNGALTALVTKDQVFAALSTPPKS